MNSVQDNDYVQSCVLNKGKSPIVIYLAKQVQDMRRFWTQAAPTDLRSTVDIDRIFNLGLCFVTTLVYKNMAVVRDIMQEHLVFLLYIHTSL